MAAKTPPKPSMVTIMASSTCGLAAERNSPMKLKPAGAGRAGMNSHSAVAASTPRPTITAKVACHPATAPIQAPAGTPTRLASVRPVNIMAIAADRLAGPTSCPATMAPIPKNAPWVKEARTRPPRRKPKEGARAAIRLPAA